MSQTLTIELSDHAYHAIERRAMQSGQPPSHIAGSMLEQQLSDSGEASCPANSLEKQLARERFERHFGSVDLGCAVGIDNEQIDADLAREYGDTHESE